MPLGTDIPLKRLDASTAPPVSANRCRLHECCPPLPTFTAGNAKTQTIESKHVINRELWVALQFPIGDDVSALYPLQSSVDGFGDSRMGKSLLCKLREENLSRDNHRVIFVCTMRKCLDSIPNVFWRPEDEAIVFQVNPHQVALSQRRLTLLLIDLPRRQT